MTIAVSETKPLSARSSGKAAQARQIILNSLVPASVDGGAIEIQVSDPEWGQGEKGLKEAAKWREHLSQAMATEYPHALRLEHGVTVQVQHRASKDPYAVYLVKIPGYTPPRKRTTQTEG